MSGINGVKYKIMPESPEIDLKGVEEEVKKLVISFGGTNKEYSIEPVAFGLKALIAFFFYPEEKNIEELENKLSEVKSVASVQLVDMRKIA